MAQISEFTSTSESYFILDGVKYPKSYEAVDDSSLNDNRLKVIPIGRTGEEIKNLKQEVMLQKTYLKK